MRTDFNLAAVALLATSASAATIKILVGSTGLTFSPNSTTAAVGDELEFHFYPKAHDVVRGAFASPCGVGAVTSPFASGYVPSSSGEAPNTFKVLVNDTNPIWYYCSQTSHCQKGMVGVINPPATGANTLTAYAAAAALTNTSVIPTAISGGVLSAAGSMSTNSSGNGTSSTSGAEMVRSMKWVELAGLTAVMGAVAGFML